jgi:predicted nucleotidyltransferase
VRNLLRVMRKTRPIDSLLTPIKQEILSATYGQPEKWWYLSELAANAATSPSSLQRELSTFAANGLLLRRRDGGRIYFKAATDSPLFSPLKELLERSLGPAGAVREAIAPLIARVEAAFIYGSVAKGEEHARSDVDILFIGALGLAELVKVLKPLERKFGREFNAKCYSTREFVSKFRKGNHFVSTVIREPKIFLAGNEDDLRRLVGEPLDK